MTDDHHDPTAGDDLHRLAAAYALDALDDDERRTFEDHLLGCAACADEVAGFAETAGLLGAAVATAPPPALRDRVLAEVHDTVQVPVSLDAHRARRRAGLARLALVAAALAVIAALAAVVVAGLGGDDPDRVAEVARAADARTVVLAGPTVDGQVELTWSDAEAAAVLEARDLPDVPDDETYQLWFIGADGPVSAGTFRPDDDGRVEVVADGDLAAAEVVGITVEPAGGSPAPTGDVLLSAELSA